MALGGLDIGTSGCKCTVMTAAGRTLASRYQAYAVSRTAGFSTLSQNKNP